MRSPLSGLWLVALLVALWPQLVVAAPQVSSSSCHPRSPSAQVRPAPIAATQPLTTTDAAGLFVCRVDVAGAAAGAANTRALTALGLALLVASRWLHLAGYALAFGVCAFQVLAARALAERPTPAPHLTRLANGGIALLVLAEPLALLAQTAGGAEGAAALAVLGSGYGLVLAQRLGAALLLWTLLGAARDGFAAAPPLAVALGAALAALNGAANPAPGAGNGWLGAALTAIDQAALAVLVGGGAALGWLWRAGADGEKRAALRAAFRPAALASLAALAASALAMVALRAPAPGALLASPFALTLLAKLAALLVGAYAAGLAGRRGDAQLWRAAGAAAGGALALAGLLVSLP